MEQIPQGSVTCCLTGRMTKRAKSKKSSYTHGQCTFPKNDDIHIERFQVSGTVRVLIKTSETHEEIVPEEFYFLSRLLHKDILRCQRMDGEHLKMDKSGQEK